MTWSVTKISLDSPRLRTNAGPGPVARPTTTVVLTPAETLSCS